jgi:hypothetical protein
MYLNNFFEDRVLVQLSKLIEDSRFIVVDYAVKPNNLLINSTEERAESLTKSLMLFFNFLEKCVLGVDNVILQAMRLVKGNTRRTCNGKCLVIVQSGQQAGELILQASVEGLIQGELVLKI